MSHIVYTSNFDAETAGQPSAAFINAGSEVFTVGTITPSPGHTHSVTLIPNDPATTGTINSSTSITDQELYWESRQTTSTNYSWWGGIIRETLGNGYFGYCFPGGTLQLFADIGGAVQIGSNGTLPSTCADGDIIANKLTAVGSTISLKCWNLTAGDSEPSSPQCTGTDTSRTTGTAALYSKISDPTVVVSIQAVKLTDLRNATTYTVSGPSGGLPSVASSNFTATTSGLGPSADLVITPNDGGAGGTFTPTTITIHAGTLETPTFTYTPPAGNATRTISFTHTGGGFSGGDQSPLSYVASSATSTTYSVTGPSTGVVGVPSSNFTVTPNLGGPSATLVVTPAAAGCTFSPASLTFATNSTTSQTFTCTATSTGAKTISFTHTGGGSITDPSNLTYTASTSGVVQLDDPNIWYCDSFYPTGSPGSVTAMTSQASQSYFKFGFTGTSVDIAFGAIGASGYSIVELSVDGLQHTGQISLGTSTVHATISGLTSGSHQAMLMVVYTFQGNAQRWASPIVCTPVTAIQLDAGATTLAPNLYPMRALIYGDSITEGYNAQNNAGVSDYSRSYGALLCNAMNAEYTVRAFGGTALAVTSAPGSAIGFVPNAYVVGNDALSTWNKRDSAHSMLNGSGQYFVQPDYVFMNLGTNDIDGNAFNASLAAFIPAIRLAAPNAIIFCIVPFAGSYRSNINAAVATARTAGDTKVHVLDIGTHQAIGISGISVSSGTGFYSNANDGVHPNTYKNALVGAVLSQSAGQIIAGGGGSSGPVPQIGSSIIQSR